MRATPTLSSTGERHSLSPRPQSGGFFAVHQTSYVTLLTYVTGVMYTRDMNTTQTLPKLPAIIARDMYAAQCVRLTADDRATVKAYADFARAHGIPSRVTLSVYTPSGALIGGMSYNF